MNQQCKVCGEPAAGFHFGAFTCEGCKSFFGRTYNNLSSISECKNNGECVINKKNRTACKACRLRKCILVGMSKSGSRYGRRSNWFKIHCLLQEQQQTQSQKNQTISNRNSAPSDLNNRKSSSESSLLSDAKIEQNVAKYLENLGTNINSYRIRSTISTNNNNTIHKNQNSSPEEHKFAFYESNLPSSSHTEDSNHSSSSINVDGESTRDGSNQESPHFHTVDSFGSRRFHHGIESTSPFSQKYHHFLLSPFLQSPSYETSHFETQDTPIDLSLKSKALDKCKTSQQKRISSRENSPKINHSSHPTTKINDLEKRNPLDLTLLPRCNPILG